MTQTESRPKTAREWQQRLCTACEHTQGLHFETFDRTESGCGAMVQAFYDLMAKERCICKGFDREDQ